MKANVLPFPQQDRDWSLGTGTVKGLSDSAVMVETPAGIGRAEVAFSCLVAPMVGDEVLLARTSDCAYVLAVLGRYASADVSLDFKGDVTLRAPSGRLDLVATEGVGLTTSREARIVSERTSVTSGEVQLRADTIQARARELTSLIQQVNVVAHSIDTVARSIGQRVETMMRWVSDVETASIGNLIQHVRDTFSAQSDRSVITAKRDLRLDGDRIHLG